MDYLLTEISKDYINDEQSEYLLLYVFKENTLDQKMVDKKINKKV